MKKKFFFMAAAAIALTSCSNEDVVEVNNGNAIDFRATMGAETNSRGVETNNGNLDKFLVTAVLQNDESANELYFHDVLFSKDAGATNFTSENTYYWPGNGKTVKFYAYSYIGNLATLEDADNNVTINATNQKIAFTPATTTTTQLDLVTATAEGSKVTVGAVALNFDHALSQIQVKALNGNPNYKYEVTGVKIANVKPSGVYDFTTGWTASGVATSYETTVDAVELGATAAPITTTPTAAMLIPQQLTAWNITDDKTNANNGAYLAVKVKITMTGTGTEIFTGYACVAIGTKWEAGNCYVYTLDFTKGAGVNEEGDPILGGPIEFTADVKKWEIVNENKDM